MAPAREVAFVGLGTTVMTNALLERKGRGHRPHHTAGFRDLLEIARQKRPHTFDPFVSKPEPLVPRQLRREVVERIGGRRLGAHAARPREPRRGDRRLLQAGVTGNRGVFPEFLCEPRARARDRSSALRERWPQAHVSVSTDVLPEFREYERLSSTVVNAYLMPVTRDYFRALRSARSRALGIPQPPFIMNSGGGIMTPDAGRRAADRHAVLGAQRRRERRGARVAPRGGYANIITFDMGGTSTDVCLVQDGKPQLTTARIINGVPLKAAALDVHTVGAGGSSIAWIDAGGMLRVGPHSAGARPGPACYGRGGERPTVTDANVVLGRLNPEYLLGGALQDRCRALARRHRASTSRSRESIDVVEAAAVHHRDRRHQHGACGALRLGRARARSRRLHARRVRRRGPAARGVGRAPARRGRRARAAGARACCARWACW